MGDEWLHGAGRARTLIAAPAEANGLLRALLERVPEAILVAEAADGRTALDRARVVRPRLTLLDIPLAHISGLVVARKALRDLPDMRVVIVSAIDEPACLLDALRIGVAGYLLTTTPLDDLACSVRRILAGETRFDPAFATRALQSFITPPRTGRSTS